MKSATRAAIGCAAAGLVLAATHAAQADTTIPGSACSVSITDKVGWSGGTAQSQWANYGNYVQTLMAGYAYTFYCPVVRSYSNGGLDHIIFYVYNADGASPLTCTIMSYSSFGTFYGGVSNSSFGAGNTTLTINTTNSSVFPEQPGGDYVARCQLYTNDRLHGIQYLETPTP